MKKLYQNLLDQYGPQGWWPLVELRSGGALTGYHPNDYSYPHNRNQQFEICLGAILTQNTTWVNVEKALTNLDKAKLLDYKKIIPGNEEKIKQAIRPAGYYNQKTRKILEFSSFFPKLKNKLPTRDELLILWGIGPETADSILLYAYQEAEFVVDTYTKRLLLKLNLINKKAGYGEIKDLFETNLEKDYIFFQEFHALIVAAGKDGFKNK